LIFLAFFWFGYRLFFQASAQMPTRGIYSDVTLPYLTNFVVQLSVFLIALFVGTYRLSSHARLEAFVIQTKLN